MGESLSENSLSPVRRWRTPVTVCVGTRVCEGLADERRAPPMPSRSVRRSRRPKTWVLDTTRCRNTVGHSGPAPGHVRDRYDILDGNLFFPKVLMRRYDAPRADAGGLDTAARWMLVVRADPRGSIRVTGESDDRPGSRCHRECGSSPSSPTHALSRKSSDSGRDFQA